MKIALAQLNPTVGDIAGNTRKIIDLIREARQMGAELVIFPELALFGYPPKDLLRRSAIIKDNVAALEKVALEAREITAIVGFVQPANHAGGPGIQNAAAVCQDGRVVATYAKRLLPTYDVFDETRYFTPGEKTCLVDVPHRGGSLRAGLTICEDIWNDAQFGGRPVYGLDPIAETVRDGAQAIINIGASPFVAGKQFLRENIFAGQMRQYELPLLSVNQVGGNDDLLFDGASFALDGHGQMIAQAPAFQETLWVYDTDCADASRVCPYPDDIASICAGLQLGIRDYLHKCGFEQVIIGLSGGIDSAVTAALAVRALGPSCVSGVAMPSRYSSEHSVVDAEQLAANLGIEFRTISIEPIHIAMEASLAPHFSGTAPGLAEENIQARIRGNLLMALSNKFNRLLLTTGNKSELAVGYCTLYGDMCGGLAVLCDVPKTTVYELANFMNDRENREFIPRNTIAKPPAAELRENQVDEDSLPPYDILDAVLEKYIEEDLSVDAIVDLGFDRELVKRVTRLVDRSEYKRQQAPVGIKVTSRAFGSGRRMPIAARY
ncbi:MAG: NAD+ synthase [Planctomycetota bacterium]|jgi:NAD+ synthetase